MKVLFIFLCLNFGFMCCLSAQTIKIISYNIRLDVEGDAQDNWHQRKKELATFVLNQNPDFLGIQEGLYHQVAFLEGALKNYKYIGVGRDDGKTAGEFMAIFYNAENWTLESDATFWLSETPATPSMGWDAHCFRVATYGIFKNKKDQTFALFNTHFDHAGEIARTNSVAVLESHIKSYKDSYPLVLIGDFNVVPEDPVYTAISSFLTDSRTLASEVLEYFKGTFNGFKISAPFERRIDFAFVDEEKIIVKKYSALTPLTKKNRQLSDHFPIIIEIEIK